MAIRTYAVEISKCSSEAPNVVLRELRAFVHRRFEAVNADLVSTA
jgi:hypothetical protein